MIAGGPARRSFVVSKLMSTHHGTVPVQKPVDTYVPPRPPPPVVEEASGGEKLVNEYIKAIVLGDRREVKNKSKLEDEKIDFMLDPERVKLFEFGFTTAKGLKFLEQKIEPAAAWFKIMLPNKRGRDAEGFIFYTERQGTSEYWKVVKIDAAWRIDAPGDVGLYRNRPGRVEGHPGPEPKVNVPRRAEADPSPQMNSKTPKRAAGKNRSAHGGLHGRQATRARQAARRNRSPTWARRRFRAS